MILNYNALTLSLFFVSGPAVPPWVGFNDEDTVQQQVLALSAVSAACFALPEPKTFRIKHLKLLKLDLSVFFVLQDKRNFLRDPPAGVHFHFDWEQMYPVAMVMLEEDELLQKMRFHLVPKQCVFLIGCNIMSWHHSKTTHLHAFVFFETL